MVCLLSTHESNFLYNQELDSSVMDYREQFPLLPLAATVEIAAELGVDHPVNRESGKPCVMSTDFILSRVIPGQDPFDEAICIKEAKELDKVRTLEKLEIERRYWRNNGTKWRIVTENEIDVVSAANVDALHRYHFLSDIPQLTPDIIERVRQHLQPQLLCGDISLAHLSHRSDKALGLSNGLSLTVSKHLFATRIWKIDFTKVFNPSKPVHLL